MKHLLAAAVVTVTTFSGLMGTAAMADSHGHDRGRDERRWNDDRDDRHDSRHDRNRHRRHDHGYSHDRRYDGRYRVVHYYPPQGYRHYTWYRGARLPAAYYAPRYVVHNYGAYRLRHPPRGYHWVRVDNDVILAAVATGLVVQVVNGIFY